MSPGALGVQASGSEEGARKGEEKSEDWGVGEKLASVVMKRREKGLSQSRVWSFCCRALRALRMWMWFYRTSCYLVPQMVKLLPAVRETWVRSLGQEDPLEKEKATHSSTLDWRIPWMEKPGRLHSMRLQRVRYNWATSLSLFIELSAVAICLLRMFSILMHWWSCYDLHTNTLIFELMLGKHVDNSK